MKCEISTGVTVYQGDALEVLRTLPSESVNCVVTSPPYWGLRDYGTVGQLGLESTPEEYVRKMVEVFREVRSVLRDDGTLWLNMGDSYASHPGQRVHDGERDDVVGYKQATNVGSCSVGSRSVEGLKPKDLCGIPWMLAFALRADGWYLRSDIIWHKPNPMPESVTDRPTKSHEYIFLLSKREKYHYDADAIAEDCTADHLAGNTTHKGTAAYDAGDEHHRTKQGLVAYAEKSRRPKAWDEDMGSNRTLVAGYARTVSVPDNFKGSIPGRKGGPGQDRRSANDRGLGKKGREADDTENRAGAGHRFGRGAGWRDDPTTTTSTRNKRTVWTVGTQPFPEAHFATFPEELIKPCILAGCPAGGTVLDPFFGSGTTGLVAQANGCKCIGIELNPAYIEIAKRRLRQEVLNFAAGAP